MRILRPLLLLAFASTLIATAHAQIGIYGSGESTHASSSGTTSAWFGGFNVGAYDELYHAGPIALGADARGSLTYGSNANDRALLLGPRLSVHAPALPVRPYVVANVGVGGSEPKGTPAAGISGFHYDNKLEYGVLGGVEYTVLPHIDWRVVEVGYERRSGTTGYPSSDPVSLFNLATGVVIRFR